MNITQDDLVFQFKTAHDKGWRVKNNDFPKLIEGDFFPEKENIFKALEKTSPKDVKYFILGQDPYFSESPGTLTAYATGVAFAISRDHLDKGDIPDTLKNIMDRIFPDRKGNPDISEWADKRGILLFNSALTVKKYEAGSHLAIWRNFTTALIRQLRADNPDVKFIAWGSNAKLMMCKALEPVIQFTYGGHPQDRRGGQAFEKFWRTPVGRELISTN
jgi:uracil-DNA glycosylase